MSLYFLQSFADSKCSGKQSCQLDVYDIAKSVAKSGIEPPCPLELSSYLQAGHSCLEGTRGL